MILLIDNYDSFVHNLARYFRRLGQTTHVVRNDAVDAASIHRLNPQAIVISPGPGTPNEAGHSVDIVREFAGKIPLLGICLGHQVIATALGGKVVRAHQPVHGRTSVVEHHGSPLFTKIPSPFTVCRYHSLTVERASLPDALQVTATNADGQIMAIEHPSQAIVGVQFHPEAVLTDHGYRLLKNFLALAGFPVNASATELATAEYLSTQPTQPPTTKQPVTF